MKHWSAEFQPRSLCNFGDGGPGDSNAGPEGGGDQGGYYTGDASSYGVGYDGPSADTSTPSTDTSGPAFTDSGGGPSISSDPGGGTFSSSFGGGSTFSSDPGGGYYSGSSSPSGDFGGGWMSSVSSDFNAGPGMGYGPDVASPGGWGPGDYGAFSGSSQSFAPGGGAYSPASAAGPYAGDPGGLQGAQYAGGPQGPQGLDPTAPTYGQPGANPYTDPLSALMNPPAPAQMSPEDVDAMQSHAPLGAPPAATTGPLGTPQTAPGPELAPNPGGIFAPDDRSEAPSGQQQGFNVGNFFGPSQAQAATLNSDFQNTQDTFARAADNIAQQAQNNPALAQALNAYMNSPGRLGDYGNPFAGPSPGAQQGFGGTSPAQQAAGGPFTGPPQSSGPQASALDARDVGEQGKAGANLTGLTSGILGPGPNAQQTINDTFNALSGKGPGLPQTEFDTRFASPNEFRPSYDPNAPPPPARDTLDTRFGDWPQTPQITSTIPAADPTDFEYDSGRPSTRGAETETRDDLDTRFGDWPQQPQITSTIPAQTDPTDWNYAPQAQTQTMANPFPLAPAGQVGPTESAQYGPHGQVGPGMVLTDPNQLNPDAQQFMQTLGLRAGEDVISNLDPATRGVGREAAPLGLWGMMNEPAGRTGGSPFGSPAQAGGRTGGGPFGGGRETEGGRAPLSVTVSPNVYAPSVSSRSSAAAPSSAGRPGGMYPGAQYGGFGGANLGLPGTNSFGLSGREGALPGAYFIGPDGQVYATGAPPSRR